MDTGILGGPLSGQCFRGRRPTGGQQTGGFCGILCLNVKTTERTRPLCQRPIRTRSRRSRWSAFVRTDTSRACRPAPSSSRKNSSDTSIRKAQLGHHHGRFSSPAELIWTFLERAGSRAFDYYNNDRYQWELMKLSPAEYFQYLQTRVYPLPIYDSGAK